MRLFFALLFGLALLLQSAPAGAAIPVAAGPAAAVQGKGWKARLAYTVIRTAYRARRGVLKALHIGNDEAEGFAIASLACGVAGLTIVPFLGSIAAIIFGIIALNDVKREGGKGRGMAIAGIVLGGVGVLLGLLFLILVFALIASI